MKKNCWLIFGAMLSTSLLAQQVTNAPPAQTTTPQAEAPAATTPAPAAAAPAVAPTAPVETGKTNAPATKAKSGKKKSAPKKKQKPQAQTVKKEKPAELKTTPLMPGPATVEANNVNIRGQAKLNSEVVGKLNKGQEVTVLEEIVRNNSGPTEPSAWARILLPAKTLVWVNNHFITNNTVGAARLNLRSGPGENYSVLGRIEKGQSVTDVTTKGDWTQIEAPTNAYAFVAAQFLKQGAPEMAGAVAANSSETKPTPATPSTVTEPPPIAPAASENPTTPTPAAGTGTNALAAATPATPEAASAPPAETEPPPKRIVQREGFVKGTSSIQAPTHFELVSLENGRPIDFLFTSSPSLDLRRYKGLRIIVTGEESLDDRWPNTPVITIQKIQVLEEAPHSPGS